MTVSQMKIRKRLSACLTAAIFLSLFCFSLFLQGCAGMMSSAASGLMQHLSGSILNNNDLELVESGAPAYLLLIDSLISQDPENITLLSTAATLYSAYADVFVDDTERSRKMADKSLGFALKAFCLSKPETCGIKTMPFEEFDALISKMAAKDINLLFTLGNAWAGWILANKNDFNAIADMARIEKIMTQVVTLDPTYQDGAAYLYLGTMATLLPPAMGGKPEQGRQYFETALKLSKGKNLMVKVMYAKLYARMVFDRELHDRLLEEVLAADPEVPGQTLINTYAQQQAQKLLADAEDYF